MSDLENETPSWHKDEEPQGLGVTDAVPALATAKAFLKPWKFYVMIVLAGLLATQTIRLGNRDTEIAKMEGEQKDVRLQLTIAQEELKKCKGEVKDHSQKVADAAKDTAKLAEDFEAYKKDFETRVQKEAYKRAELIAKKNTPKTCEEARQFLLEHAGQR